VAKNQDRRSAGIMTKRQGRLNVCLGKFPGRKDGSDHARLIRVLEANLRSASEFELRARLGAVIDRLKEKGTDG
jgi:hypothetical protein